MGRTGNRQDYMKCTRTNAVVLVVESPVHQGRQLLEVLLGLVEGVLEQAELLELVRPPRPLVGEHHGAEAIVERVRDDGQERANGLVAHVLLLFSLLVILPLVLETRRGEAQAVIVGMILLLALVTPYSHTTPFLPSAPPLVRSKE